MSSNDQASEVERDGDDVAEQGMGSDPSNDGPISGSDETPAQSFHSVVSNHTPPTTTQAVASPPVVNPAPAPAPTRPNVEPAVKSVAPKEEKSVAKSAKVKRAKAGSKYTFFVGPGNNGELVRATIERRPWWELGKEDDPELNLKWLQVIRFL